MRSPSLCSAPLGMLAAPTRQFLRRGLFCATSVVSSRAVRRISPTSVLTAASAATDSSASVWAQSRPVLARSLSAAAMEGPAEPGKTRVGWIGTGVMGASMCAHLLDAGYAATVYNRTASKCAPLLAKGAAQAGSPREVAAASDVVFTIVGFPSDVEAVTLGEDGALAGLREGGILVEMTTAPPALAERIAAAAAEKGCGFVDAPVSGGDVGAREARLSIMVGGAERDVACVQPLFQLMGKNIRHMGPAGKGQHTKCVNQVLIASGMIGVCEGLLYAHKAGLDLDETIAAVGAGAAGSWSINNLGPRIAKRNFDPGFFVEHFVKDMGIALDESKRMGLSMPGLALANQLYLAVMAQGHARLGTHSLMLALEQLNGIDGGAGGAGGAGGK